ncbi:MAG: FAD-binding protein [Thermoplasmata archaeon]
MEFVVLAKAVPALDSLDFDPVARTVRRDDVPLYLNPFDQRALRVALELRRPGEHVTVVSLGPPAARATLREARAVGADRAVLISDPAFAGSDVLATATALAAAVGRLRPGAVLAGAWTTDSGTGLVGPELAALLGWSLLTSARSVRRLDGPTEFEAVVDTATGWTSYRGSAPVVVTVGEKIAKPLRAPPEAMSALGDASVELWSAADLGADPMALGLRGSPTLVESVLAAAPPRTSKRFDQGPVADRVRAALEELSHRMGTPSSSPGDLPPPPEPRADEQEMLVLVTDRSGRLDRTALGIAVAVRRRVPGGWPSALWVGDSPSETETHLLERAGALAGYLVRSAKAPVEADSVAAVVEETIARRPKLAAATFAADPFGRAVAGRVAGHRHLGVVGEAIDLARNAHGEVVWSKPSFGGRTVASVRCRRHPALATFRSGAFGPPEHTGPGGFGWSALPISVPPASWLAIDEGVELDAAPELEGRDVIVAVGMGLGGPEGLVRLAPTIARWNAGLVATRRVVDAGWVPRQLQVGLTGRALAPRLAVLLGVSGSVHHLVGWRRAGTVLAVNRDPGAPVFRDADIGIVGSVEEVLPALDGPVARLLGR